MRITLISLLVLVLSAVPVHARIGETLPQMEARYGKSKKVAARMPETVQYQWEKDGFIIEASLNNNGVTILEFFHRTDKVITEDDIRALLKNYLKNVTWAHSLRDQCYKSSDNKLIAGRQFGHADWFYVRDVAQTASMSGKDKAKGL